MSVPANPRDVKTRSYRSERRRAQAEQTSREIVEAANRLFVREGYAATTMAKIAQEAGVVVETIYRGFDGKAGLLHAVVESAVAGGVGRAERPVEERPALRAVIDEPDPWQKLELYAATQPGIHGRAGPLMRMLRQAAAVEPDLAPVLDRLETQRVEGLARFAQHLEDEGALRDDVSVEKARDILWTVNSLAVYDLLVLERGWPPDRYQDWITAVMRSTLLPD